MSIINPSLIFQRQRSAARKALDVPSSPYMEPLSSHPAGLSTNAPMATGIPLCCGSTRLPEKAEGGEKRLFIQMSLNVEPGGPSGPVPKPLLATQGGAGSPRLHWGCPP